jgi:hypothetical protein
MQFGMLSTVKELVVSPDCKIEVDIGGSVGTVHFRSIAIDDTGLEPGHASTRGILGTEVITTFERDVPPDLVQMLSVLAEGRVPAGHALPASWIVYSDTPMIHSEGFAVEGSMPVLWWFPEPMQAVIKDLERSARDATRRVVDLVRWRCGKLSGSHTPVELDRFEWSVDGARWFTVPWAAAIYEDERLGISLSAEQLADIREMAAQEESLSFAHVLIREAWELKLNNPRSSILLGVAAAEVGIKQAIKVLVPASSYLVEKLVLPQLADLMKNYVPELPAKLQFGDAPPSIPPRVRNIVWKGVQDRNKLVHRPLGGTEVIEELQFENVDRLLRAVHDLLLLLDYYCGKQWAAELLSNESREALALPPLPPEEKTLPVKFVSEIPNLQMLITNFDEG